jgi:hypothetical protein
MAARNLSPKQIAERTQRHRRAVMVLALQRAKAAVLAQIRADGQKIGQFSAKEIRQLQEDYFAANMEQLITKAVADITTSPRCLHISEQMHRKRMGLNQSLRLCRCQVRNDRGICTRIN